MRERKHLPRGYQFKEGDNIQTVVTVDGKVTIGKGVVGLNKAYVHGQATKEHMWSCEDGGAIPYSFDPYGDIHFSKGDPIDGYIELLKE